MRTFRSRRPFVLAWIIVVGAAMPPAVLAGGMADLRGEYAQSDEVRMTFYTDISHKEIYSSTLVSAPEEVRKVVGLMKGTRSDCAKCGTDGLIEFFGKGVLIGEVYITFCAKQLVHKHGCITVTEETLRTFSAYRELRSS